MKNQEQLDRCISSGVIPLVDSVNREMADSVFYVIGQLLMRGIKQIHFLVSSSGGNGRVSLEIVDAIRLWPGEKIGIVCGRAHSAAAVILQAFDKRWATVNSTFVIHHGKVDVSVVDLLDKDRVKILCQEIRLDETRYTKLFMERTKMSEEAVWKLTKEDRNLFVEEAIKLGIIDGVWDKPLPWINTEKK